MIYFMPDPTQCPWLFILKVTPPNKDEKLKGGIKIYPKSTRDDFATFYSNHPARAAYLDLTRRAGNGSRLSSRDF